MIFNFSDDLVSLLLKVEKIENIVIFIIGKGNT